MFRKMVYYILKWVFNMGIMIENKRVLDMQYLGKKAKSAMLNGECVYATDTKVASGMVSDAAGVNLKSLKIKCGRIEQPYYTGSNLIDWENPTTVSNCTVSYNKSNNEISITLKQPTISNSSYVEWDITSFARQNVGKTLYFSYKSLNNNAIVGLLLGDMLYPFEQNNDRVRITSASKVAIKITNKSSYNTSFTIKEPMIAFSLGANFEPYTGRIASPSVTCPQYAALVASGDTKIVVNNGLDSSSEDYKEVVYTKTIEGELGPYDYLDVISGDIVKKTKKVTIVGGAQAWTRYNVGTGFMYLTTLSDYIGKPIISPSYGMYRNVGQVYEGIKFNQQTGELQIYTSSSVTNIVTYMASNPLTFYTIADDSEQETDQVEPMDVKMLNGRCGIKIIDDKQNSYSPTSFEYYVR